MSKAQLALAPENVIASRVSQDGWARTDNPNYDVEVATSPTPWFVPQRMWTREKWDMVPDPESWAAFLADKGPFPPCDQPCRTLHRVARCYDPRPGIECWLYRPMMYDETHNRWVMMRAPRPAKLSFFHTAAKAKGASLYDWKPAPEWSP